MSAYTRTRTAVRAVVWTIAAAALLLLPTTLANLLIGLAL